MKVATRFKIVGVEVVGLGAFMLFLFALGLLAGDIQAFQWDYAIFGGTLVLIGFEILSLIRYLPAPNAEAKWR